LGMKYLWIDRFCIDQGNTRELSHQVALMDMIYKKAELTIVASCGDDPSYGLPGVGNRPRIPQKVLDVGNDQFFLFSWNQWQSLQQARWMQRGWTYQEAVFSRRRLVFTDYQVYFECHEFNWWECWDLRLMSDSETYPKKWLLPRNTNGDIEHLFQHLKQYSTRVLGKPEDIINAFSGILHNIEIDQGIQHCWGVFILPSIPDHWSNRNCPWNDATAFFAGLCWQRSYKHASMHGSSEFRRRAAPSWSWAGWDVEIEPITPTWWEGHAKFDTNIGFKVELSMAVSLIDSKLC